MSSKAQQKKKAPGAAKAASTKTTAERLLDTERRLCEDRRALEDHSRLLAASLDESSTVATERLAARLEPLKKRLRDLLVPARSMDLALQHIEDARAGLPLPEGAPSLLDVLIEAEPFGTSYDPDTKWSSDAPADALERAALDLFDDLHRQCEGLDAAIKKAEADAQAAYNKLVKPVREQQIPACLDGAKRLAQKTRNLTAARHGRPLPFAGLGTAVEIHEAAKKALSAKANLPELVGAAIDALDIKGPSAVRGAPGISDGDILDDEPDTVEDTSAA